MDVRYKRGQNPRSLANLRPVRPGQVLNPEGRNQVTKDREGWAIAVALVRAIEVEPDHERYVETLRELVRHCLDAGIAGNPRVVIHLLQHLWPVDGGA